MGVASLRLVERTVYLEEVVASQQLLAEAPQGLAERLLQLVVLRSLVHLALQELPDQVGVLLRLALHLLVLDVRPELHSGFVRVVARGHRLRIEERLVVKFVLPQELAQLVWGRPRSR